MSSDRSADYLYRTLTLEAFADTIVPGEKRSPDDVAIVGASTGPGAVAAGAIELLETPATGIAGSLDSYARDLNDRARAYASSAGIDLDESVPPFAALSSAGRIALVQELTALGNPEKDLWVLLALFCIMAFDTAPHMHTTDAIGAGHPGLTALRFAKPDPDGLWRFRDFSYGRPLARIHPRTTSSGSPA